MLMICGDASGIEIIFINLYIYAAYEARNLKFCI